MIRAVLFDRDDTLTVTDPGVYRAAGEWIAGRYGVEAREAGRGLAAHWQQHSDRWWGLRSEADEDAFWDEYGHGLTERLGLPTEAAPELLGAFPYERYLRPVPQAREVLQTLRARGLKVGVLSNTLPSIGRTLEAVDLADLVDTALATCSLGVHKPEHRAFELAAQAMELPPEAILFVDDRPENVSAAREVGMAALQIDLTGQTPGVLHSLPEVLDWLDGAPGA